MPMIMKTHNITAKQAQDLQEMAEYTTLKEADLIRRAIDHYIHTSPMGREFAAYKKVTQHAG